MNVPTTSREASGRTGTSSVLQAAAGVAAVSIASAAFGGFSDPIVTVVASNAQGSATFMVPLADGTITGGVLTWALPAPVSLFDTGNGNFIAQLNNMNLFVRPQTATLPNIIGFGFDIEGGASDTRFVIDTTTFDFPGTNFGMGRTSAAFGAIDFDDNGVTVTGFGPGGAAFTPIWNDTNVFANLFVVPLTTPVPGGSANRSESFPGGGAFLPLPGTTVSMTSHFDFVLTAEDFLGVTSAWEIIPAPGAAGLLSAAGLVLLRRRR